MPSVMIEFSGPKEEVEAFLESLFEIGLREYRNGKTSSRRCWNVHNGSRVGAEICWRTAHD